MKRYIKSVSMLNISNCSEEAREMYKTGKGYRDDTLFGEGYRNPQAVLMFEILELGNIGAILFWAKQYINLFSTEEKAVLSNAEDCIDADDLAELFASKDEFSNFCKSLITKVVGDRNYCVWLCASPDDVQSSYIYPFADNGCEWANEYTGECIEEFNIPDDAIILDDLGSEGCLWCWKQ